MRRLAIPLAVLLAALLLPGGCGGGGIANDVIGLLTRRSGEMEAISYTCITEDAGRIYREHFELRFPDDYSYSFYEVTGGQERLLNHTVQRGIDVSRARVVRGSGDEGDSLLVETITAVPPIRFAGNYLALYHLVGNADYFQSLIALVGGGELVVAGMVETGGREAYLLESASGLTPRMRIWLDRETAFPVRKELDLSAERTVAFRYEDVVENPDDTRSFSQDVTAPFGDQGMSVSYETKDGGCRSVAIENAGTEAGFAPLLPRIEGFVLTAAYVRDPAASTLSASEESTRYPEGFRELYLVLRDGVRQVEIRQSPYDPEFSYYTTGLGALSGAFLARQEAFGDDAAGARYIAAVDCQEMRLTAGDVEVTVTGDLSREEFETLARHLAELAE